MDKIKDLGHVMIDIETIGTESNSIITALAAVEFDLTTGEVGRQFYERIDIQSSLDLGLKIQGQTILWWLNQGEEARKEIGKGGSVLALVLYNFSIFINSLGAKVKPWGNSARFDCGIIADSYNACKLPLPWKFSNERDVRTLVSLNPSLKQALPFIGVKHNAIDDCLHQIKYCTAIWNSITIKTV